MSASRLLRIAAVVAVIALGWTELPAAGPEPIQGANYPEAFKYSPTSLRPFVYDTAVTPGWIGKTDVFWYGYKTSQGMRYYRVDPRRPSKEPLFDHERLAALLSEETRKPVEPGTMPISRVSMNDDGTVLKFVCNDFQYEYALKSDKLTKLGRAPRLPVGGPGRGQRGQQEQQQQQQDEQQRQQQQQQDDQQQQRQDDNQQQNQQQQNQQQQEQRNTTEQNQRRGGQGGTGGGRGLDYRNFSPDRKVYVFVKNYNLYLAEAGKEKDAIQITKDGTEDYGFGGRGGFGGQQQQQQRQQQQNQQNQQQGQQQQNQQQQTEERRNEGQRRGDGAATPDPNRPTRANVFWSPDSKSFAVQRSDSRGVQELFLVNSLADPRPTLEKYKYPMPGEEGVRRTELWVYQVEPKKFTRVEPKWKDESYSDIHWSKTSNELRFLRRDRLRRTAEACSLDPVKFECRCVFTEGFDAANLEVKPMRYVEDTGEMIWWSERSGWGHFYLYDKDGKLKNAITSGTWRASDIVAIDAKNRTLYFRGNAREPGENVYYQHLYRVNLDGTGLTLLDPGDAHHNSTLSPSRQFLVDNSTRIDQIPNSVLRDASGKKIMDLETADLSRLFETGWKMPETFVVKAADGVTDLYGNMWKPYNFDPNKKYPIVAHVYPGPQTEGVTHTFSPTNGNQALAQLGMIVVQVGHRGGTPTRSKAYHSFSYFNMRDYGLADKKSAIEQLAARHPWIDISRVGIYGHSGGGFMSAAAVLQKPYNEFFKAAVASAGNHDNNIYNDAWAERYHGLKEVVIQDPPKTKAVASATATNEAAVKENADADDEKKDDKKSEGKKDDVKVENKKDSDKKDAATKDEKKDGDKKDERKDEKKEEVKKPQTKFEIKVPTNAELAANLKGHLLLVHGEIDNNVHPANTMRLVDALIKANKRFDMLILPGKRHGFGDYQPYCTQRMWDFFAEHLLNERQTSADIMEKTNGNGNK